VCQFFEKEYGSSSVLALISILRRAIEQKHPPEAIISFNADTLLYTLIELYQRHEHYAGPPPHSHPKYRFKTVLRPSDSAKKLIPIATRGRQIRIVSSLRWRFIL
jgi:hypothetical protein